mmetsp:Transcript_11026/g.31154  ORF Transcript_11026/g.31154 Transcript_11026/m.31154 type:complete len:213 (-) Transcript_11026:1169-1807(-)
MLSPHPIAENQHCYQGGPVQQPACTLWSGRLGTLHLHSSSLAKIHEFGDLFCGASWGACQWVFIPQLLPLLHPKIVVRQQLDELERWLLRCPRDEGINVVVTIGVAWDQHVPQLIGNLPLLQLLCKVKGYLVLHSWEPCQHSIQRLDPANEATNLTQTFSNAMHQAWADPKVWPKGTERAITCKRLVLHRVHVLHAKQDVVAVRQENVPVLL